MFTYKEVGQVEHGCIDMYPPLPKSRYLRDHEKLLTIKVSAMTSRICMAKF